MTETRPLDALEMRDDFASRHIGPTRQDVEAMLEVIGVPTLEDFLDRTVPASIRHDEPLALDPALTEREAVETLRAMADRNRPLVSMIGMGYYGTVTPPVVLRNVFEDPAWYTAYTPYQAEVSQGRLEALLNFQQMVMDLTGMELANASLLDEATAAAEAMAMARRVSKSKSARFFVDADCHPQTIAVVRTRAAPLGIDVTVGDPYKAFDDEGPGGDVFGVLVQYPGSSGALRDPTPIVERVHAARGLAIFATDLLAACLVEPPGAFGADIVVGSAQRFGVPMGFGGPHAAFFATRDAYKRQTPGRIIGVSVDARGRTALRMALQTREQHIRREKATSNICTAQVLLAVMAAMYAVYHGPERLRTIAERVHRLTRALASGLTAAGREVVTEAYFDTITVRVPGEAEALADRARNAGFNVRRVDDDYIGLSLDETTRREDVQAAIRTLRADVGGGDDADEVLGAGAGGDAGGADVVAVDINALDAAASDVIGVLARTSEFLTHPVFHEHHSETEMMRYLRRLAAKDVALDRSMIPLGSCTMKLNATAEMIPVTFPGFGALHSVRACRPSARLPRALHGAGADAVRDHRLRRGIAAAQRRLAGRVHGAALHPPVSRVERGGQTRRLPDPRLRARHQPRERDHGRDAGGGRRLRRERQCRPEGSGAQGARAQRAARRADDHLSIDPRRVRGGHRRHLQRRPRARRAGVHGWREPQRDGRAVPARVHRGRRLAHQPPQDVLHSARRRRAGHGSHRGAFPPCAVSAGPSRRGRGQSRGGPVGHGRHGVGRAVGVGGGSCPSRGRTSR